MRLDKDLKIRIVQLMAKNESISLVQRALRREKWNAIPTAHTINNIYNKFCTTGSVFDLPRSGRPKKYDENDAMEVDAVLAYNPQSSLTEISGMLNISRTSVFRLMHSELGLKSYKIEIHQKLFDEDFDRRVESAESILPYLQDPSLNNLIFFSDEATFHISGHVHKQNCRIWSTEKPVIVNQFESNTEKINVWCAMSSDCIIGPYFFEENVTSQNYLAMLKDYFFPIIQRKRIVSKFMFQQDGASPHFSLIVRNWLNDKLPGRWIGRRGPIEWPARSPDLTPLDFFLWGYVKQVVYKQNLKNLDELRESITNAINSIGRDVIKTVFSNIEKRLQMVIDNNGAHIEQLI